jgi:xylose isomerase
MAEKTSFHSICRWTFNPGKGGFVPGEIRSSWSSESLDTVGVIELIKKKIQPRLPDYIQLGAELHYDNEYDEDSAPAIADAIVDAGMYLAMATPGLHFHWGYGGVASMDAAEREKAEEYGSRAAEIAYGDLKKAWHPDDEMAPSMVLWNGAYGYDLPTVGLQRMYQNLKDSVAKLCRYESTLGGKMYICIEPKPNEGHAAMLLPTVASGLLFWKRMQEEHGISLERKGLNMEFGHTEMIGLDIVYDTVEQVDNDMMVHVHVNSQGYNDGIILGGPGKFDIDNGVRINGFNIAVAGLMGHIPYRRWKGHDMQPRPYDDEEQAIERVIRSILSWEACEKAAAQLEESVLLNHLINRDTAKAEDMMRDAVVYAQNWFNDTYKG